jgi:hypothetical protein
MKHTGKQSGLLSIAQLGQYILHIKRHFIPNPKISQKKSGYRDEYEQEVKEKKAQMIRRTFLNKEGGVFPVFCDKIGRTGDEP